MGPRSIEGADESPSNEHSNRFQVLSLDGGGIKGLFSAAVLAELEADLQTSLINHFDLIVGTSTGGLIALGLGAGIDPARMVDFYVNSASEIFGASHSVSRLFRPKYSPQRLRSALFEMLGDRRLGDSHKRLVIPSFSLDRNDVYLFKTPHHQRLTRDWRESMVDVAMATTAAPTYFPVHSIRNQRLIDGGVWANNPAVVGVAEALALGAKVNDIRVLSLGTTNGLEDLSPALDRGGWLAWARHGRAVFLRAPSVGTFHTVEQLIGKESVVRIDALVPSGLFSLDQADSRRIRGLAEGIARQEGPAVRPLTLHAAAPYIPLHSSRRGDSPDLSPP